MNRRRILVAGLLAISLFLVTLAGCQDLGDPLSFLKSTPQSPVLSTPVDLQNTLFPEKTQTPTAEPPSPYVLWLPPRFDPQAGGAAGSILNARLESYSTESGGLTITTRIKAESGTGGLLDTLVSASAAAPAALPNLILLSRADFEKAAKAGLLAPLQVSDLPADQSAWFPFALELATVNSNVYGVTFAGDLLTLAYKTSMIAYPPVDWEGIYKQGSILTFPASDPMGITGVLLYFGAGGKFLVEKEKLTLDEKALQTGLQTFYDGASAQIFPFWMLDYKSFVESSANFGSTQSAYELTWSSLVLNGNEENVAITAIPGINTDTVSLVDGWVLAIPQSSDEKMAESLDLLEYLIDPTFQRDWSEAAGYIPISRKALQDWSDQQVSSILMEIASSALAIPDIDILEKVGPLFAEATQDLVKQQVSYIQASNTILTRISE